MKKFKNIFTLFILVLFNSCSKNNETPITTLLENLVITTINPSTGPKNTTVTITGTGFSTLANDNAVTLNGKVCPVVNSTTNQLTITIPPSAGSGKIKVVVRDANAESNIFEFIVTTTVTTFAGSTEGDQDGLGAAAKFNNLKSLTLDNQGNLIVADDTKIRKVSLTGLVTTIAGSANGAEEGTALSVLLGNVKGIVMSPTGTMFFSDDLNQKMKTINSSGFVSTYAGAGNFTGFLDGNRPNAKFNNPSGLAIDGNGNLYVADRSNDRIRKISGNNVTTFAGNGNSTYEDGQGISASFTIPEDLTIDSSGNLYVADFNRIRKITPNGFVSTLAGSGNFSGFADGPGNTAIFGRIRHIVVDAQNNLFVTDNNRIRKISSTGIVTTIAGNSSADFVDGNATTARFDALRGIIVDASGNLYVADGGNFKIRKITFD
jgi:uncharacterized protein (TIGR03437 family)